MFAHLTRQFRRPTVILFREYVRKAPSPRLQPITALSPSPSSKTAFVLKGILNLCSTQNNDCSLIELLIFR